jgi:hypothetical protein
VMPALVGGALAPATASEPVAELLQHPADDFAELVGP